MLRVLRGGTLKVVVVVQLDEGIVLPRAAVRFPVELRQPDGMQIDELSTWPRVDGRLEYLEGKLLYMPPCGDIQQDVAMDVAFVLRSWVEEHREFVVGGNEAGMLLGGEVRAADAAVWRRADAEPRTGKLRRVAPVLAVEVAGEDESELDLRAKAAWYLSHGVRVVWIVLPEALEVVVIDGAGDSRRRVGQALPERSELPELTPAVERLFAQIQR